MVAGAEHREIVGDLDGAPLDQAGGGSGFAGTGAAGDRDKPVAPAEGVGVENEIAPVAMESGQHGMGEHELRASRIDIGGGLEVKGVAPLHKETANPRAGIKEKVAWRRGPDEELAREAAVGL